MQPGRRSFVPSAFGMLLILAAASALTPNTPPVPRNAQHIHAVATQPFHGPPNPSMFLEDPPKLDSSFAVPLVAQPSRVGRLASSKLLTTTLPAALTAGAALVGAAPHLGTWYSALAVRSPLACAIATAGLKGISSDLFAQLGVERSRSIERKRTLAFASFNMCYIGAFGWYKYNVLYNALFGTVSSLPVIAAKVTTDLGLGAPLIYFPAYFIIKGAFAGHGPLRSLRDFASHGWGLLMRYWAVWFPVEILMWVAVPAHLRVAFLCSVSLIWQVALSTLSYRQDDSAAAASASASPQASPSSRAAPRAQTPALSRS